MKHLILFLALSASPHKGPIYPAQWLKAGNMVTQDIPTIHPEDSWLFLVPQAGAKHQNVTVTFTFQIGKKK